MTISASDTEDNGINKFTVGLIFFIAGFIGGAVIYGEFSKLDHLWPDDGILYRLNDAMESDTTQRLAIAIKTEKQVYQVTR